MPEVRERHVCETAVCPGFELKGKGWAATDFNAGHTGVAAAHTKNK